MKKGKITATEKCKTRSSNEEKLTDKESKLNKRLDKAIAIVIMLIIIVAISGVGLFAYAKYRQSFTGTASATVAKWYFDLKDGNQNSVSSGEANFAVTRTDGKSYVAEGKLAPGTYGQFMMYIDTRGTETDLTYEIEMELTNCPMYLKFYRDEQRTVELPKITDAQTGKQTITLKKYLPHATAYTYNQPTTIYWEWPFESGGTAADLQDSLDAQNDMTINITATATEVMGTPTGTVDYLDLGANYKATVGTGKTITLNIDTSTAGFSTFENITYTSDNTSIATVDTTNGVQVTGVAEGSTTITLTGATSGETQKIYVTVELSREKVGTWTLSSNSVTVTQGNSSTVTVTTEGTDPLEDVTFGYSTAGIATASISNKTITINGTQAGSTTITITGVNSNQTKQITVTVLNPVYTITLDNQGADVAGTTAIYETYSEKFSLTSGGEAMTTSANAITVPTRTNYDFNGYYTETNGNGTQYIDANGYLTSSASNMNFSANGTLYASWTLAAVTGSSIDYSNYGDYVDLGEGSINLVKTSATTDDWRIFLKRKENANGEADVNGEEYVYLILADYLPTTTTTGSTAVSSVSLDGGNSSYPYRVYKSSGTRKSLIDGLLKNETNANWKALLPSALQSNSNIKVTGAVDLPTWVASWNEMSEHKSGYTYLYTPTTSSAMSDGYYGYYVGNTSNTTSTYYQVSNSDTLYFPHTSDVSSCYGYWLASPCANSAYGVMYVNCNGIVSNGTYSGSIYGVRPAVRLPANILVQNGNIWEVQQ